MILFLKKQSEKIASQIEREKETKLIDMTERYMMKGKHVNLSAKEKK